MKKLILLGLIIVMCLPLLASCITAVGADNEIEEQKPQTEKNDILTDKELVEETEYYTVYSVDDGELYCVKYKDDFDSTEWEKYVPRNGATKDEANQTKVLLDKDEYSLDDKVTVTIQCPFEDDYIGYGNYFNVEYYDETTGEWKSTGKTYSAFDMAYFGLGSVMYVFKLSDRANDVGEKYRVVVEGITVNDYLLDTLYSETFTIK